MLYEKNRKNPQLDRALFENPTSEYRATPFWAWNCDLQKDELLRQIDIFKEMGLGGFHMHCRAGMSTTYLSDDFMDLVKACTDHARENQMLSWLYDEDKWPSGFGGGYVTKDDAYRQRYIVFTCDENYTPGDAAQLIARFDVVLGEDKCLKSYRKIADGEAIPAKGHGETEIKDAKDATCTEEGYTGDTYCTVCGEKIAEGETIAKVDPENPKTSEETRAFLMATAAVMVAAGAAVVMMLSRKKLF